MDLYAKSLEPKKISSILLDNATQSSYGVLHILYSTQCVTTWNNIMETEVFENLRLELRRGSLTLAVLAQLRTELYGYALRKALADHGLAIDENTLYPLLRRLEIQGLLVSHWREEEKRNKRFYRLSPQGEIILYQLLNEQEAMNAAIDRIMAPSRPPQAVSITEPEMDSQEKEQLQ